MAAKFQGVGIDVEIDEASYEKAKQDLEGITRGIDRAMTGAINKTLAKGKTMVIRQLASILTAKQSAIRATPGGTERIMATPAYGGEGHLRILGRRIGAINFKLKKTSKGYVVQYFKDGGSGVQRPGSFIGMGAPNQKGDGGNTHLFERLGDKSRVRNPHYLPNKNRLREKIGVISGLSLFDVYKGRSKWAKEVSQFLAEDVKEQLLSQTDRLLNRSKSERT